MSHLKKCKKCGQGYYKICLSCITIYEPPPELSGGQPRYGEHNASELLKAGNIARAALKETGQ